MGRWRGQKTHESGADTFRSAAYGIVGAVHPLYEKANAASADVFEAALEVQKHFGVGLPEPLYQKYLAGELEFRGHTVATDVIVPIRYKGYEFQEKLRIDVLVDRSLVIEAKAFGASRLRFFCQILRHYQTFLRQYEFDVRSHAEAG